MNWTEEATARLKQLYGTMTLAQVAAAMGSTVSAVSQKALKMGLRQRKWSPKRPWTREELDDVRQHYGPQTAAQIGARLNRSASAVCTKAREMNP